MVSLYSGTPGSGKSYNATAVVYRAMKRNINVIANFNVNLPDKLKSGFYYCPTEKITVKYLRDFCMEHHTNKKGHVTKESQTVLIIDEASILFNCREFNRKDRSDWLVFFSQHRKLGYDVILITQMDRSLDRQVRGVIEYQYIHRKLTNYGLKGWFLRILLMKSFVCIHQWYPVKERVGVTYFGIRRKIANSYDTFSMFSEEAESVQLPSEIKTDDNNPEIKETEPKETIEELIEARINVINVLKEVLYDKENQANND